MNDLVLLRFWQPEHGWCLRPYNMADYPLFRHCADCGLNIDSITEEYFERHVKHVLLWHGKKKIHVVAADQVRPEGIGSEITVRKELN